MTANELKKLLLVKSDNLFEFTSPEYDDEHISLILTDAQRRVVLRKYNPLGNKYQKGFENDELRRRELDELIKPYSVSSISSTQTGVHQDGVFVDLPSDHFLTIEESVRLNGMTKDSSVKPVTHDEYSANIENPYKAPYEKKVWRMDISRVNQPTGITAGSGKRTELILPTGRTMTKYSCRYIINPPAIVCDEDTPANQKHCILSESTQAEIVDEAVSIIKGATKPEEYQISLSEGQRSQ